MNSHAFPYIPFTIFLVMSFAYFLACGYPLFVRMSEQKRNHLTGPFSRDRGDRIPLWLYFWFFLLPFLMIDIFKSWFMGIWVVKVSIDVVVIAAILVRRFRKSAAG